MCALNEDLFRKSNLDIPDGPVKVDGATNPVYTDALNQHAKRKKDIEKVMKDADKIDELEKPFTGSTDKKNMPKKVEEPKMKLEEALFEDVDDEEEAPAKSKRGKRSVEDVYTQIYNELCGDIKGVEAKNRRFKVSNKERYSNDELAYGDGDWDIVVYADTKEGLDFAKKVAKEYGVEISDIKEYTSRYAKHKFSMQIHTDKPITNESLKPLKESDAHSDVARHFNYSISDKALDVMTDLLERVRDNMSEEYDIDEAIQSAIDDGLIYTSDIWAIKELYEEADLSTETYEALYNDLYNITSSTEEVDESLKRKPNLRESFYRGNRDIEFVWHGEWADPELIYKGYSFNYWDIEDALWYDFLEEKGYKDSQAEDPEVEKEFDSYVQSRASDYLDDCIYGGAGTPIED